MKARFYFNIASGQNHHYNKYVLCSQFLVYKGGTVWPVCLSMRVVSIKSMLVANFSHALYTHC